MWSLVALDSSHEMVVIRQQTSPSSAPQLPVSPDLPGTHSHHQDAIHLGSSPSQATAGSLVPEPPDWSHINSSFPYKLRRLKDCSTVTESGLHVNRTFLK